MNGILYVALGGAIGASGRYGLSLAMARFAVGGFPWATLAANVIGGFLMGLLAGWLSAKTAGGEAVRLFLGVGLLGGFTTFSAFSLETLAMIESRAYGQAAGYISASAALSIVAVFIGLLIARKIFAG